MKLVFTVLVAIAASAWAQENGFPLHCTDATLEGDFGFAVTGTRPSGPNAPVESVVGVAMTHFDGVGNLTQIDNIHGSINGLQTPDRKGTGTYSINPDCTGTMTLSNEGSPTLTLRIVVVDNGNEVRTAVVNPTATITPGTPAPQVMVTSNGRRVITRPLDAGRFFAVSADRGLGGRP